MKLDELLREVNVLGVSGPGVEVSAVAYDSRQVRPGGLFVAMTGAKEDGNRFVFDAVERGAVAIASQLPVPAEWALRLRPGATRVPVAQNEGKAKEHRLESLCYVQVRDARKALATVAANFYGRPADALKLVGITGTKGKTTVSYLVDSMVRASGAKCGLFGTVEYRTPAGTREAKTTTPESLDLQSFLAEVRDAGGTHAAFEVSSHALALDRVWGCRFAVAVFTNVGRDHLDFHQTMEHYVGSKRRLFEGTGKGAPEVAVVNTDDAQGAGLLGLANRTVTYGLKNGAELTAKKFRLDFSGLEFTAQTPSGKVEVRSPLVGRVNVYNILAAIGAAQGLGIETPAIEKGIRDLANVPGRFERVDEGQQFLVVVDYAHTGESAASLIETARELNPNGRILGVFGCGGERDRGRRPLMGEFVSRGSHRVYLTTDNPRSEDPRNIINDILVGVQKAGTEYVVIEDRGEAIRRALEDAQPGDIVLLVGKGHERYQILGPRTLPWSDAEEARRALRERGYGK
ncbi:MAG: UDP-N-acetylmuramoyl-L-alanyl-D-glutamate--2,6-diaminopimelate ligase [Candidatus Acidiferrales bacterium]